MIGTDRLRRALAPGLLLLGMTVVLIVSYGYSPEERALPVLVAWTTIALLALEIMVQAGTSLGRRIEGLLQGAEPRAEPARAPWAKVLIHAVAWPGLLVALTLVIGILPAVLSYVFLSLRIAGEKPTPQSLLIAAGVAGLSWLLFEWGMSYELYRGLLAGGLERL